jgi:hypothetical protein
MKTQVFESFAEMIDGVSFIFDHAPVDVFVEIGPALDVDPDVQGENTGGVGIRYWF